MGETLRAVFLSYASQDAEAARRICEALRSAGVEVWYDQSELRGGDVWDQKIRHQIRDCALFIPIISTNSQARSEGYFRLEWHLADQRTHLMARSRAFLVPVCIDDTRDAEAEVPESFSAVQWTRLPAGEAPPAFVDRVRLLLAGHGAVTVPPQSSNRPATMAAAGAAEAPPRGPRKLRDSGRLAAVGWQQPIYRGSGIHFSHGELQLRWVEQEPTAGRSPSRRCRLRRPTFPRNPSLCCHLST